MRADPLAHSRLLQQLVARSLADHLRAVRLPAAARLSAPDAPAPVWADIGTELEAVVTRDDQRAHVLALRRAVDAMVRRSPGGAAWHLAELEGLSVEAWAQKAAVA